jgi:gliding motility-associated-like protein
MLRLLQIFGFLLIVLQGKNVLAQAPTIAASNLGFSNVYCQQLRITWTNGNGSNRIVVARQGSNINVYPSDNAIYNASDTFGRGEQIGVLNYVVYRGTGNSVLITGLTKNTTYYFAVFEYNTVGGFYYLTSSYPEESVTTENITSNFDIDNDYQCLVGNIFNFVNKSANSLNLSMTYEWDYGDGKKANSTDASHSYLAGNIFTVKLTARATGCVSTTSKTDTVLTPAFADFILDTLAGIDSIQCLSNLFKFLNRSVVKSIAGTPIDETNYTWYFGDGTKGSGYDEQKKYMTSGVFEVKLVTRRRVTYNKLRADCLDSVSKKFRVLPRPLGPSNGNLIISNKELCLSGNIFTFSHNFPDILKSQWTLGDGNVKVGNPINYSYTLSGKYYITLDVEDIQGCTDTLRDSVIIYDQPNNTISGWVSKYCVGDPTVKLLPKPEYSGGKFFSLGTSDIDSTGLFTPKTAGTFEIGYEFKLGDCKDTTKVTVTVNDLPRFSIGNDTTICLGDIISRTVPLANVSYKWDDDAKTQTNSINSGGTKWAEVNDGNCPYRDTFLVTQIEIPQFELGNDTQLCGGNQWKLSATSDSATYVWSDGFTGPVNIVSRSGNYKVTATNICGSRTDSLKIYIEEFACTIFIPNAISPNRDGQNEFFMPVGNFKLNNIKIYNRWGELLYDSPSKLGWDGSYDGEIVPIGVYFFIVDFLIVEGPSYVLKSASGPLHVVY